MYRDTNNFVRHNLAVTDDFRLLPYTKSKEFTYVDTQAGPPWYLKRGEGTTTRTYLTDTG